MIKVIAAILLSTLPCCAVTCADFKYDYYPCQRLNAESFQGITIGDQIAACVAALPPSGGICNARDLPSGGTVPGLTITQSGVTIVGPCGTFNVTGTINIYNPDGISAFKWEMCGSSFNGNGTTLVWQGDAASPMFRLRGVRDSILSDFSINSSSAFPLAEGIRLETATGTTSTHRIYRNVKMNGTNTGGLIKGMRWCIGDDCGGAGPDGNNDVDLIDGVQVANYTNCAFSIEGTQSKAHQFTGQSFFAGNQIGQRGVCTTQAANPLRNSGSYHWQGGAGGGNTVADFDLGNPNDTITIRDFNLENSARLLQTGPVSSSTFPLTISGGRWAANKLAPDNIVVLYQWNGPLFVEGSNIEGAPQNATPSISLTFPGATGVAIGNSISWVPASSGGQPFIGSGTWQKTGNLLTDNAGNVFPIQ
jgi:hypothetical protein